MVTTTDTTWNPTEYSNEAKTGVLTQHEARNAGMTVHVGSAVEAGRRPAWELVNGESGIVNCGRQKAKAKAYA